MRKIFLVSLAMAMCFLSASAWAAITIDSTSGGGTGIAPGAVFGNGTPPDGETPATWPDNVTGCSVIVNSGGTVNANVYGGFAQESDGATATDNSVTINGGLVDGSIYGAYANGNLGDAIVTNNTVSIRGGMAPSWFYGGYAYSVSGNAFATDNTVSISGNPIFNASETIIYGSFAEALLGTSDAFTGNRLEIKTVVSVKQVRSFEYMDFYLPSDATAGDTMLTLILETDLNNVNVDLKFDGAAPNLVVGDVITLIDNITTGTFASKNVKVFGYTFALSEDGGALVAELTAMPTTAKKSGGGGCNVFAYGLGLFTLFFPFVQIGRK